MKSSDCIKLENQICFSLYAASREVIRLYKPILENHNLTYTQYLVMLVLWEEKSITVKDMGIRLHLDSGTLTPLLKKLELRGLITRHRSEDDDRCVVIQLAGKGLKLRGEILDVPGEVFCKMNITKELAKELKDDLDRLILCLK